MYQQTYAVLTRLSNHVHSRELLFYCNPARAALQDLRGVEEAKLMLANDPRDPMVLPDGFVRVVRVLPARANAMQGR